MTDGYDVCGEVTKCGPNTKFQVGDVVFGDLQTESLTPQRYGAWAEYVVCKEITLAKLPDGVDKMQAGGAGLVFGTFLESVEKSGAPQSTRSLPKLPEKTDRRAATTT